MVASRHQATPGSARTRTASRNARPVLLLTDALPGIAVDLDDAPRLPELLAALTAAAR